MKIFILKSAVIFLFCLLLFRFTIVSLTNEYENKLENLISSSNFKDFKIDLFESLEENNKKNAILDPEDAEILSVFIKKILSELNLPK
tara:strand:- start:103 stop:366 length:264 start_codon:yes stop_codon:yes gene_type:complete